MKQKQQCNLVRYQCDMSNLAARPMKEGDTEPNTELPALMLKEDEANKSLDNKFALNRR